MKLLPTFTLFLLFAAFGAQAQYSNMPITLSLPNDQDTIEEQEPTFVWQCNTSALQNDPRLEMQIVVVELEDEQAASDGLAVNAPIFVRSNLLTGSVPYSSTDHELEKGKTYAWQVSYLFNGVLIQQSEAWVFTLADPQPLRPQYMALRRESDGASYHLHEPVLYMKIAESGKLSLSGTIRGGSGESHTVKIVPTDNPDTQRTLFHSSGEMLCKVDFSELELDNGSYTFSWKSPGGKTYKLQFELDD